MQVESGRVGIQTQVFLINTQHLLFFFKYSTLTLLKYVLINEKLEIRVVCVFVRSQVFLESELGFS